MNAKKRKTLILNDQEIDAILKKARMPVQSTDNREKFTKQVLKRICSDAVSAARSAS
jgi:hypothetical protein